MSVKKPGDLLINLEEANLYIESIDDPVVKLLVDTARYKVLQGFINYSDIPDAEFDKSLPNAPFDMLFYCRTITRLFSSKYFISEILKGNLDIANQI
jgi:hypothetical protein